MQVKETLQITDRVEGHGEHTSAGGFLLAPGWQAAPAQGGWDLRRDSEQVRVRITGSQPLALSAQERPYHPDFGSEIPVTRLIWQGATTAALEVTTLVEGQS